MTLVIWTVVYALLALVLWLTDGDSVRPTDPWVLALSGVAGLAMVATMILPPRRWTTRRAGLVYWIGAWSLFALASYALYTVSTWRSSRDVLNALILAGLLVGSVAVLIGVARYALDWWRCRGDPSPDRPP